MFSNAGLPDRRFRGALFGRHCFGDTGIQRSRHDVTDLAHLLLLQECCGSVGQAISGYSRGGCLVAIALDS